MAKEIDQKLIKHIASLSRIELDDKEIEQFVGQFGAIISYFDKLSELDTADTEPQSHAVDINNVTAADSIGESLSTKVALANAPDIDNSFFKVPKVLGEGA